MIAPGPPAPPSPVHRRRDLWRNRGFRWFFVSEFVGSTGYALYAVAVVWLAVERTGSYALAGAVLALEFGIYAMSFLIAPLVDRARNLRRVAVAGYLGQAVLAAALGLSVAGRFFSPALLLVLVAALSVVWDFTWTATNALLPELVHGDALLLANGLTGSASGGYQFAGAALGAVILTVSGPALAMLGYATFNVAALVALLPVAAIDRTRPAVDFVAEFSAGWAYLAGGPGRPRLQLAAFGAFQGALSAAPPLLIALEARAVFAGAASVYGAFATALALGGFVGGLLLGALAPRSRMGAILLGTAAAEGVLLVGLAVAPNVAAIAAVLWGVVGAAEAVYFSVILVFLQATTPPELRGRAFTNTYVFRGTSRAGGALLLGAVAATVSFGTLTIGVALGLLALAAAATGLLPAVRGLAY